jgi:hypothetical protein
MANRKYYRGTSLCSAEREIVFLFGAFKVGAVGAVGTVEGAGVKSVTRTGAGAYTITLEDAFFRFLSGHFNFAGTNAGVAQVLNAEAVATLHSNLKANKTVKIQCYDYTGVAVDPASGSECLIELKLRNSSAGISDKF